MICIHPFSKQRGISILKTIIPIMNQIESKPRPIPVVIAFLIKFKKKIGNGIYYIH
jgi:hypothetical protein